MKIKVTQDHIDAAYSMCSSLHVETSTHCPIALAFSTAGLRHAVIVDGHWWSDSKKGSLPFKARNFVDRFDSGKSVKPFTFEISP